MDNCNLHVQQYHKGTIQVSSEGQCSFFRTFHYEGNENMRIKLEGLADKSCLYTVIVSPKYEKPKDQSIEVHSFKGFFYLRVKDEDWVWRSSRVISGTPAQATFPAKNPVRILLSGCDVDFDETIEPQGNIATLQLLPTSMQCILQGVVIDGGTEQYFTWAIWQYDSHFEPLPGTFFRREKNKMHVAADNTVSIIFVGDKFLVKNKATLKRWDENQYVRLRVLTVKGRSEVWEHMDKTWTRVGD